MNPELFGFRRRCGWCGVVLRWWQLNLCHVCAFYVRYDHPSPPCTAGSRWEASADGGFRVPKHHSTVQEPDGH